MKYFIDLGCYIGEMIAKAQKEYPDFDQYIGFEAVPALFKKSYYRFIHDKKVKIYNGAVSNRDGSTTLYLNLRRNKSNSKTFGKGSSLLKSKLTGHLSKKRTLKVKEIDFARYVINNFSKKDYIVLKIDIEGKEYDLLEHMIETGAIYYINKIFCEWHAFDKLPEKEVSRSRHDKLVSGLTDIGLILTGVGKNDEFGLH